MGTTKHTQWSVVPNDQTIVAQNIKPHPDGGYTWETIVEAKNKADAALIAAAPELLEALQLIQRDDRLMNALNKQQAMAVQDAIAKATGGSK